MTTNHSPIRTSRAATLHKLAFTTALAGSLALLPSTAHAQVLPQAPAAGPVSGGSGPTFAESPIPGGSKLEVNLRALSTIIGWDSFKIGAGNEVDFRTTLTDQVAVLNRVKSTGGVSDINGKLTSGANVNVFLVNPNGIMVSSSGSVSTGSFVASTLDIDDADFTAKRYVFFDNYGSGNRGDKGLIDIAGGRITTRGSGIGLILLGRKINSTGTLDSGTQTTALVAADDVTLNYTTGSPLGIQITQGTDLGNAMQVVGGSIQGRDVYFAMATKSTATDSLLRIDANVRAVGGDKGIVIVGGRSDVDDDIVVSTSGNGTSGRVDVRTGGTLAYGGSSEGGILIGATDAATVAGAVTSAGNYVVKGRSVTLGAANATVLQQANRGVEITAAEGDVTGLGGLTLAADIDGTVGTDNDGDGDFDDVHAMTIRGRNIAFGTDTTLASGGAGLVSAINIFSGTSNSNVLLGDVLASTLDGGIGIDSSVLEGGLLRGGGATVTAGTVVLSGNANLQAGTLNLGSLSAAGDVVLTANSLRAGSLTSNGAGVTITASTLGGPTTGTRVNIAAAGAIDIDVTGATRLGTINAGAATTIEAGSIDATSVASGGIATLTSTDGNIILGGLTVSGGGAVIVAEDAATIDGPVAIVGNYSVRGDEVTLGGTQRATGAVTIATTFGVGEINNAGTLSLTANSDGVGTEELKLSGRIDLGAESTLNGGTARQSNVVIETLVTNAVALGDVNAAALSIAGGATILFDVTLGDILTTADLALNSTQTIRSGNLRSTAGLVTARASALDLGAVRAATSVSLNARQVDFATIDAATATLSTSGGTGTRRISGSSVTTSGATTLTSDNGAISIGTITAGGLGITSAGNVSLGTVDVTGNATITTTGSADITLTSGLTATGAVSLTAADDIAAGSISSTGGALTITAGDDVTGVNGGRAALSAATNLTLNAGGDTRLADVTANSVTLRAGTIDSETITGAAGIVLTSLSGDLAVEGLSTSGGNASLNAFGAATIDGPVSIAGDYSVSGNGVTLGGTQSATGAVDVTARGGSIGSTAGMQLTANSDGVGTEALTLHGRANLGVDSLLRGGSDRQSQVIIDAGANTNIRLGNVDASSLAIAGGAALGGSLTFGNVVTSDSVALTVNGGIVAGGLTSLNGSVTLGGNGGATIGTVSGGTIDVAMRGNVDVASFTASNGAARFASSNGTVALGTGSATGNVTAEASGLVSVTGAITAGGDYRIRGNAVALGVDADAEIQSAAGAIDIVATNGAIVGGDGLTLRSGTGALILDGNGGIDLGAGVLQAGSTGTGTLGVRAGNGQVIDLGDSVTVGTIGSVNADHSAISDVLNHRGDVRFGTLQAANPVNIQLEDFALRGVALNTPGAVTIDTGSGAIDIGAIDAASLSMTGGAIVGGSYRASGNIALDGSTITLTELDSETGSISAITRAGTLSIDEAHAAIDMTLTSAGPGDVSVGNASAGRNLSLIARNGNVLNDSATAGGVLTLDASGDILGRDGEDPDLSGDDVVLVVVGNLVTNSITAPGSLTVTASSIRANTASAGNNLSLTATRGALSIGNAIAGGAISLTAVSGINVGTLTSGDTVALTTGGAASVTRMTAPGVATIRATGSATLGSAEVAGLDVEASSIDAGTLTIGGTTVLTSTAGDIKVEQLDSTGAVTIDSADDVTLGAWQVPAALTVTAADAITLGTGSAAALTASGASIDLTDGTVTGATELTGDTITIDTLTSGSTAITAGTLTVGALTADATVIEAQTGQIQSLTLGSLTLSGGSIAITDASVKGLASSTLDGTLDIGTLEAGEVAFTAGTILADRLTVTGTTGLTSTIGATDIGQLDGSGAITIDSAGGASIDLWQTEAALTLTASGNVVLGNGTSAELAIAGANISLADAGVTGAADLSAAGAIAIGTLTSADATLDAGTTLVIDRLDTGAAELTAAASQLGTVIADSLRVTGGSIGITDASVTGSANLSATGAIVIGTLTSADATLGAGTTLVIDRLDTGAAELTAAASQIGTVTADSLRVGGGSAEIGSATVTGASWFELTGLLDIDQLDAAAFTANAGSITAGTLGVTGVAELTSTAGAIDIGTLTGGAGVAIAAAGDAAIDSWTVAAGLEVTAAGAIALGTGSGTSLTATGGSIAITDATLTGATTLTAPGAIAIGTLASGDATITAGSLTIEQLRAGAAVLEAGSARLGTLTLGTLTLTGGSATITDATLTGGASVDLTGTLGVERLTASDVTLLAGGLATLGTIAGTNAITVRAGDIDLAGTLRAANVTLGSRDAAAGLRLGSAGEGQGAGAGLSEAEIGRIEADRVAFDGGTGTVAIGTLAFGTGTGRTRVDVLTTGAVEISGTVSGTGAGRSFRFGGTGTTEGDMASAIRVIATAASGGRLLFDGADLELRGARIGLGNSGLIDALFAGGGLSAEAAAALIGNSNSALYNALVAGEPYVAGAETTLSAARLTLRFDDFALFQNTGSRGFNTGAVLGGSTAGGPTLSLIGPGNGVPSAFAMFGTINGISGTSTAVLGGTVISTSGVDLINARINGCVLGTGAGCLTTTISQPTLNVFDPGRLVVFQVETDFTIPFDPVIGSNNEALFAGAGGIAEPAPETVAPAEPAADVSAAIDCPPGETGCTPAQQDQ